MKYTIFDVETPNSSNNRICSIGICQIENNTIISSENYFINPEVKFDAANISIHGIRPEDVESSPAFPVVWEKIRPLFIDSVLVAHNARFDLSVLKNCLIAYGIEEKSILYLDTVTLSRKMYPQFCNHKLSTLCYNLCISLDHHNSGSDAHATAELLLTMLSDGLQVKPYLKRYAFSETEGVDPSELYRHQAHRYRRDCFENSDNNALNELKCVLENVTDDGIIDDCELSKLQCWLGTHTSLAGNYPYDALYKMITSVLEDGYVSKDERAELLNLCQDLVNPVEATASAGIEWVFGKNIVITGDFLYGSRPEVEKYLQEKGALLQKSVTQKTQIVVVGALGSEAWVAGNYGTKIKKALELKEKGLDIQIIKEECLFQSRHIAEDIHEDIKSVSLVERYTDEIKSVLALSDKGYDLNLIAIENRVTGNETYQAIHICETTCCYVKGKKSIYLYFCPVFSTILKKYGFRFDEGASRWARINVEDFPGFLGMQEAIEALYEECLSSASGRFGCCSHYRECSKAGKCIKTDVMFSGRCMYRKVLSNGGNYYSKKANQ